MFSKTKQISKTKKLEAAYFIKLVDASMGKECAKRLKTIYGLTNSLDEDWEKRVSEEMEFVNKVTKARVALRKSNNESEKTKILVCKEILKFNISSMFLRDCWKYLTADPSLHERIHFVTGTITKENVRVLSRMEKVKMEEQSWGYVKTNRVDSHQKIISLVEKHGHLLQAMFHSHMSYGAKSTKPSPIDLANQERFVKIGCEAIGGIFSLDGYVRLFSTYKDFEIDVYGKGVKKIFDEPREKVFQILDIE